MPRSNTTLKTQSSIKILILLGLLTAPTQTKALFQDHSSVRGLAIRVDQGMKHAEIQQSLKEIHNLGADSVLVKVEEVQDNWTSKVVRPDPELTISLTNLSFVLDEARNQKLRAILMPIVLVKNVRDKNDWRGMIVPTDTEAWFRSYGMMISKYASVAQDLDAFAFSVGSELVSMEKHWEHWKEIIDKVRQIYKGKLFYSFNWDHMGTTPAWKELDLVGINAYFEVAQEKEDPILSDLLQRWSDIRARIVVWSKAMDKSVWITEAGYPSRQGGLSNPWDHTITKGVQSNETQEKGYQALLKAWKDEPRLTGMLFYEWYVSKDKNDLGYTPRGKPAETLLRDWFGGKS